MDIITINDRPYQVDSRVREFAIKQKASSNVDFFGTNADEGKIFVQFKNGASYIFEGVDEATLNDVGNAESVGKFISSRVAGKFNAEKSTARLITPEIIEP